MSATTTGGSDGDGAAGQLQDVWQVLELAAIHHADRLAVVDCAAGSGRQLTYAQLFERAAALAAHMRGAGVRRGDRIAILSRNSSHVIELHFAAAAIHAVVVNLNIHLAPCELAFICADAAPKLVFADVHCAPALLAAHASVLQSRAAVDQAVAATAPPPLFDSVVWMLVEGGAEVPAGGEGVQAFEYEACLAGAAAGGRAGAQLAGVCAEVLADGSEEDGFHLYYTSGTTGVPKGVLLSHRIVMHHAVGTIKEMNLSRHDVWGHFAPMFHLVDVFAVYAITLVGGRHVTLPTFTPQDTLLAIERERVSATNIASTMVAMLVNNPLVEQLDLTSLRVLSCGGSPQSPAVVVRAIAVFGCEFFLSYGMTECCGKISMSILPPRGMLHGVSVEEQLALVTSSGRPFELISVRVVGEDGNDVAKDSQQVGEVWVRGPTVFSGYWGLPAATAESFAEGGWFKTGDLATAAPNNYIHVVDRKKDMLLVGGENVYTTEVEAVLYGHPSVHQAAVFGMPSRIMGELVGAAVTLRPEAAVQGTTPRELIDWCAARLAHFKVPAAVHILPKMPTTGSGKILKTELRKMLGGTASGAAVGATPIAGPAAPHVSLAEAAAMLAAACGGGLSCQPLDAGMGAEWGRELLPDLTYVLVVEHAADIQKQVEAAVRTKGMRNVAVVSFEKPATEQLAGLSELADGNSRLLVLHVEQAACAATTALNSSGTSPRQLHTALAAARELLPPFGGVLHAWVAPEEAAAASAAVAAAEMSATSAQAAPTTLSEAPVITPAGEPAKEALLAAAMKRSIVAAIGSLLGEAVALGIGGDEPLMSAGLTSTLAVQLTQQLEASLGAELPGTLVFDYPSINEMAAFLAAELAGKVSSANSVPAASGAVLPATVSTPPRAAAPSGRATLAKSAPKQVAPITPPASAPAIPTQLAAAGSALVLQQVMQLLGKSAAAADLTADVPLMSAGLTSTLAVQLTQQLEEAVGAELPGTLVFDYPTANEIGGFLAAEGLLLQLSSIAPASTAAAASGDQQRALVTGLVLREAGNLLGGSTSLSGDAPLMSAGLTSALAVQLVTALEIAVGTELPGTLVFDYPTACEIADYLIAEGVLPAGIPSLGAQQVAPAPVSSEMAVVEEVVRPLCAVTSSSHRVPGGQLSFQPVTAGNDRIGVVPLERWDVEVAPADNQAELNQQFGSFLAGADQFDAAALGVSPAEALLMDPQQRLVMQSFSEAMNGHLAHHHPSRATGVYVGVSQLEYARISLESGGGALNTYYATGAHLSVASGRLSFTFGFKGPAMTVDTACSSSLVTTHLAAKGLERGECEAAASVGVNLTLVHSWTRACLRAGMLSEVGRCKTLDASADGYVRAEGVGAIMLALVHPADQPAARQALAAADDGNKALAWQSLVLLAGSSVNQDGRSSSLTAPNGPSQQEAVNATLRDGDLSAWQVSHLQMHGTGTPLGDPIEVGAVAAVLLKAGQPRAAPLHLTAAKSFMGHAEPAAGIVGIAKLALIVGHQLSDPILHLTTVNHYVAATVNAAASHGEAHRVAAPRQPSASMAISGGLYLGGISSFAFQGTNAHAILGSNSAATFSLPGPSAAFMEGTSLQHSRYWVLPAAHPLIGSGSVSNGKAGVPRTAAFDCNLLAPHLALYADHVVFGRVLFPGAGMMETVLAAGTTTLDSSSGSRPALAIAGMAISSPLIISHPSQQQAGGTVMRCSLNPAAGDFQLAHAERRGSKHSTQCAGGSLAVAAATAVAVRAAAAVAVGAMAMRRVLLGKILALAAGHATGSVVVDTRLDTDGYLVPPPCMDACLHLGVAAPGCGAKVPVALGAFALTDRHAAAGTELAGCTTAAYRVPAGQTDVSSFAMHASAGGAFASLGSLETKVTKPKAAGQTAAAASVKPAEFLYEVDWEVASHPATVGTHQEPEALLALGSSIMALELAAGPCQAATAALTVVQQTQAAQAPALKVGLPEVLSCGTSAAPGCPTSKLLAAGAVEGLLRVAATEHASAAYSLTTSDRMSAVPLALADTSQGTETGILSTKRVHKGVAAVPRLLPSRAVAPAAGLLQIRPLPRGSLASLASQAFDSAPAATKLKCHDVMVAVKAVGINFRDVLNVLGMYPGDPGPPGSDCAGIVMHAGSASGFKPGDAVFGLAHGCLGTVVSSPGAMLAPMPSTLSFHEAATTPTVFITVEMAMEKAAAMAPGDRVLVHAAAGGVGLAAIQVAQAKGAVVLATAGGTTKRSLLQSLGVPSVLGSRDTVFVSEAAQLGGADIVLNSLTSSGMVGGSLAALSQHGRFVEISKRDIWSPARVAQERPDVLYSLVAVDFLPPSVINTTLHKVAAQLAAGVLRPLRQISHSMGSVASAFRQMIQASHVGKVVAVAERASEAPPVTPARSYPAVAITGGSGGLGLMISQWLVQCNGPAHILLLSRSGRVMDAAAAGLAATAACISSVMSDTGAPVDATAALGAAAFWQGPALQAVLHASGVLADSLLGGQTASSFRRVFAPKLGALETVSAALQRQPVAALALFSSVASLLGAAGQANYAAANAAMDACSHAWQATGCASKSIQWGAWASSGMASEMVLRRLHRIGQGSISADQGLLSLAVILRGPAATAGAPALPQLAVNAFIWGTYLKSSQPAFFEAMAPEQASLLQGSKKVVAAPSDIKRSVAAVASAADPAAVREQVKREVAAAIVQVLGTAIGDDEPLMSAGLDSLGSVEFANVLSQKLGMQMPGTLVFDYPSVNAVTEYLTAQMLKSAVAARAIAVRGPVSTESYDAEAELAGYGSVAVGSDLVATGKSPRQRYLAILAVVARPLMAVPLSACDQADLAADRIHRVPFERWDLDQAERLQGDALTQAAQFGAFMLDADLFDGTAHGLSAAEAAAMDPQHRLVLEASGEALLASAPLNPVAPARTGVFVGISWTEYARMAAEAGTAVSAYTAQGAVLSVCPGRVAYHYGLKGPAVAVDTACSSSLVATSSARDATLGSGGAALAGGINMMLAATTTFMFKRAGMLSVDGRCKALDKSADGYVRSEACALMLLGSHSTTEAGGALVLLLGSAVNQGGRASSLTAPNGPSQQEVVRLALASAGMAVHNVAGLQLHGTGTTLGDPIELGAAAGLLLEERQASAPALALAASKSSLGHSEPASGIMGMAHLHQALSGAASQPILHLTSINPHVASIIPRPGSFFMPRQHAPSVAVDVASSAGAEIPATGAWGVSAFAFQGTNAHALLALASADSAVLTQVNPRSTAWSKERFWVGPERHALIARVARVAGPGGAGAAAVLFEADLMQPKHAHIWDHAVAGRPLLPGAAFLEVAAASLHATCDDSLRLLLTAVIISVPLDLPAAAGGGGRSGQQLLLQCQVDAATGRTRVASVVSNRISREHMYGAASAPGIQLSQWPPHASTAAAPVLLMLLAATIGAKQQSASFGRIEATRVDGRVGGSGVEPACLDASFHLGALPAGASSAPPELRVPAAIAAYQVHSRSCSAPQLLGGCQPILAARTSSTCDYWLASSSSRTLCHVSGLQARTIGRQPPAATVSQTVAEVAGAATGPGPAEELL